MAADTLSQLNERYILQTGWTRPFREFLYRRLPGNRAVSILEVGCGTGAVLRAVRDEYPGRIRLLAGLDIDQDALRFAKNNGCADLISGTGEDLPFPDGSFDFVFCHYVLLWAKDPIGMLTEMKRVTADNGLCAVMAEPCYSEMRAEPRELYELADAQRRQLVKAGADMDSGRRLAAYFEKAGFPYAVTGQYEESEPDAGFLKNEAAQISNDTGSPVFEFKYGVKYKYCVPTYFAYAVKC